MNNSTPTRKGRKPARKLPVWRHPSGRWCKKVRGRFCYFGKVADDPDGTEAAARWEAEKDDLLAGRDPAEPAPEAVTVKRLVNVFLRSKKLLVEAGRMKQRSWQDYYGTCKHIVAHLGRGRDVASLRPADFEKFSAWLAKGRAPKTLLSEMTRVASVFKYAYEADLIDRPVKFGPGWRKPSKAELRKAKAANGSRMFTAAEVRAMLAAAGDQLKAAILLAVNGGLGNEDLAQLRERHIDLSGGWLDYPRPKTGTSRRIPLWTETKEALIDVLSSRQMPRAEADADRVFLSGWGLPLNADATAKGKTRTASGLCQPFRKLLEDLGLYRPRRTFYSLRHVFQTIGDEARDPVAVKALMGHIDPSMSGTYREGVSDDRLRRVVGVVHDWLFADAEQGGQP